MKFPLSIVIALLISTIAIAQEKCETPNEAIADQNSITKCSIDDVKKSLENSDNKQLSTRKRHRKVRQNNVSIDPSNKVENVKNNALLVQKLNIKNDIVSSLKKIPFHLVEQIPLFKKCKNTPLIEQSKCFEQQMVKHIVSNFNYPKEALINKIEGKVLVQFTIDKEGNVIDIKKRGPKGGELLESEASRLIAALPKFISGMHNGNNVNVKYALPIIFKLPKKVKKTNQTI
ncbi:energy transducer TonB [uncultured Tenacibaculum sp.]|uniref:energy transducer TonB n=1 Tax=uncultured Tenacibaculum sp. TaxID=174713 RepID=UPI0026108189|nr:energy transducer TonB [uncultured Tenacibaculum sp.]